MIMMKYIKTAAPVPIEQIKEYFKDKTTFFLIDYLQSKIQGKILLVYLSNLDIPSDLIITEAVTKEQKFELLEAYFDSKSVSNIPFLNVAATQIILYATGIESNSIIQNKPLTDEECEEFINIYQSLIDRWIHFIDSSMLFLIKSFNDLDEKIQVKENFENIDDGHYVGLNVINLFEIPGFLELYFSTNRPLRMSYFVQQFESHMFKGNSFYHRYFNEYNMFFPLLYKLINKELPINPEEVLGN